MKCLCKNNSNANLWTIFNSFIHFIKHIVLATFTKTILKRGIGFIIDRMKRKYKIMPVKSEA